MIYINRSEPNLGPSRDPKTDKPSAMFLRFIPVKLHKPAVYVITGDWENYKIGKTTNIHMRLKQLQTGNALTLRVIFMYFTDTIVEMDHLEKTIHHVFHQYNGNGEWFNSDIIPELVIPFIQRYRESSTWFTFDRARWDYYRGRGITRDINAVNWDYIKGEPQKIIWHDGDRIEEPYQNVGITTGMLGKVTKSELEYDIAGTPQSNPWQVYCNDHYMESCWREYYS